MLTKNEIRPTVSASGDRRPAPHHRIIIVEDDEDIAESIRYNLERDAALAASIALTGEEGLNRILRESPNLVLLDVNLPHMSGFELCRRLRHEDATRRLPVILLTARTEEADRVLGLELGADDYMVKPFSMRELLARVQALLRRTARPGASVDVYDDGTLHVAYEHFIVRVRGEEVRLTRKEFNLLRLLAESRGRVLTRDYLLSRVWGRDYEGDSRTLDVHIRRVRQKLGLEHYIETVIGIGYRFVGPSKGTEVA